MKVEEIERLASSGWLEVWQAFPVSQTVKKMDGLMEKVSRALGAAKAVCDVTVEAEETTEDEQIAALRVLYGAIRDLESE